MNPYKEAQEGVNFMERKMFGHRLKRKSESMGRDPGAGQNYNSSRGDEDFSGRAKDAPPNYEGKEHMKYKNPGFSKHKIRYPEDEPHMKSEVSKEESHRMEDDYHMDIPDQTEDTLPEKIKRARMKMDAPNQQDPKPILGNLVHNAPYRGEEDTSGEEEMGPNEMQSNSQLPKEMRKKMIAGIARNKMKKQRH